MGKTVITEEMFPEIVECYNQEGRSSALNLLRSKYGITNTYFVMKRIKGSGKFFYDKDADKFSDMDHAKSDAVFMNLDELCRQSSSDNSKSVQAVFDSRAKAMENLVHELVSDRLLVLSRYVVLDTSTRTVMVDQTTLMADGYRVVMH